MMLFLLLEQLVFPAAIYTRRGYSSNTMSVTILFWTSVHNNGSMSRSDVSYLCWILRLGGGGRDCLSGSHQVDKNAINTVIKYLNYGCLNRMDRDFVLQ
ncbi:hypothetical protein ACQJBY_000899 [Aegilops geniculata]